MDRRWFLSKAWSDAARSVGGNVDQTYRLQWRYGPGARADAGHQQALLEAGTNGGRPLAHKRYSCSAISFFWGVDRRYEVLGAHTLFLADDYRQNFECIDRELGLPANPSLYVHAPARLDPAMAPPGHDTLIAVVPVGHLALDSEQAWSERRDQTRQHILRRLRSLGVDDLEAHLKFEVNFTPRAWRKRYNLVRGATHGLCHNLLQLGYFRPDLQHPRYLNLYFAGASTRPGTGLPTAMVSGRLAAQRLMDDLGR